MIRELYHDPVDAVHYMATNRSRWGSIFSCETWLGTEYVLRRTPALCYKSQTQTFALYRFGLMSDNPFFTGGWLVTIRVVVITAMLVSCLSAQRATVNVARVFARYGIHAVTGATPEGDAELNARLGPEVMTSLGEVRPHVAMIRNDGPHSIVHVIWISVGCNARWKAHSHG